MKRKRKYLTDSQLREVEAILDTSNLPGDLPELVDYIGSFNALKLADQLGGVSIYIPLSKRCSSPAELSDGMRSIVDVIGVQAAIILVRVLHETFINIAKCDALFIKYRNKIILDQRSTKTSRELAIEYGLTQRHIKRISNTQKSDKQQELFKL